MSINTELFKRYSPAKKYQMVKSLTTKELFLTRESTILRCLKEVGTGDSSKTRSKFKTLYLANDVGNNHNSTIENIYNGKKDTLYLSVYIQGYDTDHTVSCELSKLFLYNTHDVTLGSFTESYYNDDHESIIKATYSHTQRAEIIREILLTYIIKKYNYEP